MARTINAIETFVPGGAAHIQNRTLEPLAADPTGAALWAGREWLNVTQGVAKYSPDGTRIVPYPSGAGSNWKPAARVLSAADVTIATPGATVDGITMVLGDRVVLAGQTDPIENGIYEWNGAGVPMTRVDDMDTVGEADAASVLIEEGTAADSQWMQTADDVTPGTDAQTWVQIGPAAGVAAATETVSGIVELATTVEAAAGTDTTRAVTAAGLTAYHDGKGGEFLMGAATGGVALSTAHGLTLGTAVRLDITTTDAATGFDYDVDATNDGTNIIVTPVADIAANAVRVTYHVVD